MGISQVRTRRYDSIPRRRWAAALFKTALPAVEEFSSPRAWAFALLGLDSYCTLAGGDVLAHRLRKTLADRLMALFAATETADWVWFEDLLAYDNARLSQALIQTGVTTQTQPYVEVGLRSLRWLMSLQTTSSGYFRPVGTKSFGRVRRKPEAFDQQPVEASATIAACLAHGRRMAARSGRRGRCALLDGFWAKTIGRDSDSANTGGCLDGLHPDGPMRTTVPSPCYRTCSASSKYASSRGRAARSKEAPAKSVRRAVNAPIAPQTIQEGLLVPAPLLASPELGPRPDPARVVADPSGRRRNPGISTRPIR